MKEILYFAVNNSSRMLNSVFCSHGEKLPEEIRNTFKSVLSQIEELVSQIRRMDK